MTLYRYEVTSLDHQPWLSSGDPVMVDATPMVRLTSGVVVPAVGFRESLADAKRDAADKLELMLQRVQKRIASLRNGVEP